MKSNHNHLVYKWSDHFCYVGLPFSRNPETGTSFSSLISHFTAPLLLCTSAPLLLCSSAPCADYRCLESDSCLLCCKQLRPNLHVGCGLHNGGMSSPFTSETENSWPIKKKCFKFKNLLPICKLFLKAETCSVFLLCLC